MPWPSFLSSLDVPWVSMSLIATALRGTVTTTWRAARDAVQTFIVLSIRNGVSLPDHLGRISWIYPLSRGLRILHVFVYPNRELGDSAACVFWSLIVIAI